MKKRLHVYFLKYQVPGILQTNVTEEQVWVAAASMDAAIEHVRKAYRATEVVHAHYLFTADIVE